MKTEHVEAIVRFLRRVRPADLILPLGAALVSAGLSNLTDREDRQRRRLAALDELVDVHRDALADAGVQLPADLTGDEEHPLDIEGAIGIILARTPAAPDNRITENPNPKKRPHFRRALFMLGLAGAAGVTVWARGYARTYGQEPTPSGVLAALRTPPFGSGPGETDQAIEDNAADYAAAVFRGEIPHPAAHVHQYASDFDSVCETCGAVRPSPADAPPIHYAHDPECNTDHAGPEPCPTPNLASLQACGWPGCDWTSDASRTVMGQATSAAIHRNKCLHRPAGAQVSG